MGRSRAALHSPNDDSISAQGRSSKRKRTDDNFDPLAPVLGFNNDGKKAALYHCNYCNKDISVKIRIKCVSCPDFDLCIECFSVGVEFHPHKSNHPYKVMDNLAFPLICPDWNADEEILLLEGIEMYGLGNWTEVSEHVGTKSKSQCVDHYNSTYMNSPCFPLPDMSHVMGKSREELLAMAKEQGNLSFGKIGVPEESALSARIKLEDPGKLPEDLGSGEGSSCANMMKGATKRVSGSSTGSHDEMKVEDRSIGEKKPRLPGDEGPSMKELSGYNSKRREFEIEYDNDAEQLLADMEFKETDSDGEHDRKLQILHIYSQRLDERKRRKDFVLDRNLLYRDPLEKDLTLEEKELCHHYRVFMRYHSKEEHEELLRSVIEEYRILKRIQYLQEARAAGCCKSAEAEKYIELKIRREINENAHKMETLQSDPNGKYLQRHDSIRSPTVSDSGGGHSLSTSKEFGLCTVLNNWDVTGFLGADILSEDEKQLCGEIRILPTHYLNMLQTMSEGILNGKLKKKSDAYELFNVDPKKIEKVYDMLVTKVIAQS